jgi:hypothetical protein
VEIKMWKNSEILKGLKILVLCLSLFFVCTDCVKRKRSTSSIRAYQDVAPDFGQGGFPVYSLSNGDAIERYGAPPSDDNSPSIPSYADPSPQETYGEPPLPLSDPYGVTTPPPSNGPKHRKKFTTKSLLILFGMSLIMLWVLIRRVYFREAGIAGNYLNGKGSKDPTTLAPFAWDLNTLTQSVLTLLEFFEPSVSP